MTAWPTTTTRARIATDSPGLSSAQPSGPFVAARLLRRGNRRRVDLAFCSRRGRPGGGGKVHGHAPLPSEPRFAPNSEDTAVASRDPVLRRDRPAVRSCDDRGWLRRRAVVPAFAVTSGPPIDTCAPVAAGDPVAAGAPEHRTDASVHGLAGALDRGDAGCHRHTGPQRHGIAAGPHCHGYTGAHRHAYTRAHGDTGASSDGDPCPDADPCPDGNGRGYAESHGGPGDLLEPDSELGNTRAIRQPGSRFE